MIYDFKLKFYKVKRQSAPDDPHIYCKQFSTLPAFPINNCTMQLDQCVWTIWELDPFLLTEISYECIWTDIPKIVIVQII